MGLWIVIALTAALAVVFVILPVFRRKGVAPARERYDVNVYKDQIAELEREAAQGRLDEAELEAARVEIQRRMLAIADQAEKQTAERKLGPVPIFTAAALAPICAVVFYMTYGNPGVPDHPLAERANLPRDVADGPLPANPEDMTMAQALSALAMRLEQNPDDIDGWVLLARSYVSQGEMARAARAYERAVDLTDRNPELLADWAEARFMANGGSFNQTIFDDFVEARNADVRLPKPWFYIGLDKAMAGQYREAVQMWIDLKAIVPGDERFRNLVQTQIDQASSLGGFNAAEMQPSDVAKQIAERMEQTPPPMAGPSAEDVRAAQDMSPEDREEFIRSMVERLASRLEENPNDPEGWARLIRAYTVLGETDKAAAAQERLDALSQN